MLNRRHFLGATAMAVLAGCGPSEWLVNAAQTTAGGDPRLGTGVSLARHVLNRCTFGARPGDLGAIEKIGITAWIDQQLEPTSEAAIERLVDDLDVLQAPAGEAYEYRPAVVQNDVVRGTLLRAVYAQYQLREVVIGCWRDQFNVGAGKGDVAWLVASYDREVVRAHALGSFRDLLRASVLHPAMLWYLDGRSNVAEHPNENHARELLELHGLGVDAGYTQHDVMEVARCLTGWTVRPSSGFRKGTVEFVAGRHDDGEKHVLGSIIAAGGGAADIERVVDLIAAHPAAARHVARRLCARFIADVPPEAAVRDVAAAFTASRGDLRATVRAVLTHAAFTDPLIRGAKLKRPLHYLVSMVRVLEARTTAEPLLLQALQRLGEAPWQHPTPEGYPERAEAWTGLLWWRWRAAWDVAHAHAGELSPELAFGRQPTAAEAAAIAATPDPAERRTLLLAAPAFQRC
jgi:uncharacterized protein (DUF1800 family)